MTSTGSLPREGPVLTGEPDTQIRLKRDRERNGNCTRCGKPITVNVTYSPRHGDTELSGVMPYCECMEPLAILPGWDVQYHTVTANPPILQPRPDCHYCGRNMTITQEGAWDYPGEYYRCEWCEGNIRPMTEEEKEQRLLNKAWETEYFDIDQTRGSITSAHYDPKPNPFKRESFRSQVSHTTPRSNPTLLEVAIEKYLASDFMDPTALPAFVAEVDAMEDPDAPSLQVITPEMEACMHHRYPLGINDIRSVVYREEPRAACMWCGVLMDNLNQGKIEVKI